ncbi:Fe-S cluster assembly protein SufD [Sneathiella sp.]|jgi:Fe-S cluster assembly protein SufD|uniref:Fe-S cluster assembly protein SufD n=1 Tax=Sneathiella sp. TaxID=1964365 RepID=UPI0039E3F2E8
MKNLTPLAQQYIDQFDQAVTQMPGSDNRSVTALRKEGLTRFSGLDFPHKRIEEWRYTNLAALTKPSANDSQAAKQTFAPLHGEFAADCEMVFIDGRFSADASSLSTLPEGVTLSNLASSLGTGAVFNLEQDENRALMALNTAYMQDGFSLHVDDGVQLETVLVLTFRNSAKSDTGYHSRNLISLGRNASLTILERHEGEGAYFANPVTRISLAEGATLEHYKLQNESVDAFHLALIDSEIAKGANYTNFCLSTGGRISRNELKSTIIGEDAESHLNGAYLMRGSQHTDTTTLTEHTVPKNTSSQIYKGVLDDKSHGVFQGKIHISEDAQQVTGDQLSKALLLSDYASVDCKPELEIYADDVKCSHGATSGELDEDALFYLQSRGISEERARKMLIEAFLGDVLETVKNQQVKEYFSTLSTHWLTTEQAKP